ncbi:MAG: type II secretion system protein [Planctomycetota bacterium]
MRTAFTLIELLVVVAVIAILIALVVPAAASARDMAQAAAGTSNLRQLGIGLELYREDYSRELPQARWSDGLGDLARDVDGPCVLSGGSFVTSAGDPCGNNIGALFGGTRGTLSLGGFEFGVSTVGADERPLNPYVVDTPLTEPDLPIPIFEDPADVGMPEPPEFIALFGNDTSSTYRLLGSSYNLNDHALDDNPNGDDVPTLVPEAGGASPPIANPSLTWVIGSHPIYNFDDAGDRGQRWVFGRVSATLVYADGHARTAVDVPEGIVDTTRDYTFLPTPGWRDDVDAGGE